MFLTHTCLGLVLLGISHPAQASPMCRDTSKCDPLLNAAGDIELLWDTYGGSGNVLLLRNIGSNSTDHWPMVPSGDIVLQQLGPAGDTPGASITFPNEYYGSEGMNGPEFIGAPPGTDALGILWHSSDGTDDGVRAYWRPDTASSWADFSVGPVWSEPTANPAAGGGPYPKRTLTFANEVDYSFFGAEPGSGVDCVNGCFGVYHDTLGPSGVITGTELAALGTIYARTLYPGAQRTVLFTGAVGGTPGLYVVPMHFFDTTHTWCASPDEECFGTPSRVAPTFTNPKDWRETLNAAVFPGTSDIIVFAVDASENLWVLAWDGATVTNVVDSTWPGHTYVPAPNYVPSAPGVPPNFPDGVEHMAVATGDDSVTGYYQLRDDAAGVQAGEGSYRLEVYDNGGTYELRDFGTNDYVEQYSDCSNGNELIWVPGASPSGMYLSYERSQDLLGVDRIYRCEQP